MKIHFVFSVKYLRQNLKNLLPNQKNALLLPIQITVNKEYKVQKIIAVKLIQDKLIYKTK